MNNTSDRDAFFVTSFIYIFSIISIITLSFLTYVDFSEFSDGEYTNENPFEFYTYYDDDSYNDFYKHIIVHYEKQINDNLTGSFSYVHYGRYELKLDFSNNQYTFTDLKYQKKDTEPYKKKNSILVGQFEKVGSVVYLDFGANPVLLDSPFSQHKKIPVLFKENLTVDHKNGNSVILANFFFQLNRKPLQFYKL